MVYSYSCLALLVIIKKQGKAIFVPIVAQAYHKENKFATIYIPTYNDIGASLKIFKKGVDNQCVNVTL
jgi:hypothetical protein